MEGTLPYYSDTLFNLIDLLGGVTKILNPAQAFTGTSVPVCSLKPSVTLSKQVLT